MTATIASVNLNEVNAQHFNDLTQKLAVQSAQGVLELAITRVQARPAHQMRSSAPCCLQLSGPAEPLLAQGTYHCTHAVIGTHELFLVPIARSASECRYELIFN
jgi:hypothetical protein